MLGGSCTHGVSKGFYRPEKGFFDSPWSLRWLSMLKPPSTHVSWLGTGKRMMAHTGKWLNILMVDDGFDQIGSPMVLHSVPRFMVAASQHMMKWRRLGNPLCGMICLDAGGGILGPGSSKNCPIYYKYRPSPPLKDGYHPSMVNIHIGSQKSDQPINVPFVQPT